MFIKLFLPRYKNLIPKKNTPYFKPKHRKGHKDSPAFRPMNRRVESN